jgi:hypothetical protein
VMIILPGHAADQGRLGCLVVVGESQDAITVASLALDLLRFPLPGDLPNEPFRVRVTRTEKPATGIEPFARVADGGF